MQKIKYLILPLLLLLCFLPERALAQILDDSTKLVYGPLTTNFINEDDLLFNTDKVYNPDTAITHFHRFTEIENRGYRYQNLGNLGTAMAPIFYQAPETIGERSGYYVYDHWFRGPGEIRYYNTKSPYTRLKLFMAGNGRSWLDVTHTRNINPRWNVGLDFRRLTADKQIGPSLRRDDKQVVSTAYDLFTYYRSTDSKYHLMANFSRIRHNVKESGGIAVRGNTPEDITEIIEYEDSEIRLQAGSGQEAASELFRINYHVYQQYQVNELATVYHRLDRQNQRDSYVHNLGRTQNSFYNTILISPDSTADRLRQVFWKNELGLKGDVNNFYYRLYYKRRDIRFDPKYLFSQRESEDYAGFNLRLAADSTLMLSAEAEYLVGGFYNAGAFLRLKWLEGSVKRIKYKPAFIHETYFGNHNEWYNNFEAPVSNELDASVNIPLNRLHFKGGLQAKVVENHIYFTADSLTERRRPVNVRPQQAGAGAQILSPYASLRWEFAPGVFLENELIYTKVTGKSAEVFNTPDWLYNGSLYFEGPLFGGKLHGQTGVDVHWRSAYYANAYDPVTRQFLVQHEFEVPSYPVVDVFFGFRLNRTRVFVRMSHVNQGAPAEGYFITPYYSGVQRTFDLGIDWLFFD